MKGQQRFGNHVYIRRGRLETKISSGEDGAESCREGEVASKKALEGKNVACAGGILPSTLDKIGEGVEQRVRRNSSMTSVMCNGVERAIFQEINVGNHGIRAKGKTNRDEAVKIIAVRAAERRYRPAYSGPILTNGKGDEEGRTWAEMRK